MNLTNHENQLPYFTTSELKFKILVDTGSTKSFIKPSLARKYYNKFIREDPFEIRTAHGKSTEKHSIIIPAFDVLKSKKNLKLHLFDFHEYFDCLIGMDILQNLGFTIDLANNILKNSSTEIKLQLRDSTSEVYKIEIYPECEQVIEIHVRNIQNGDVIIPEVKIGDCYIKEGAATVKNGKALCTFTNPTDKKLIIEAKPMILDEFNKKYICKQAEANLNNFDTFNGPAQFNFDLIRTEHMNNEEKHHLKLLLESYSDLFHIEGNNLTFTNKIKHHIRTRDEEPAYTKSYRYPEIHREEIRKQIDAMLNQGIIRHSYSPWNSPIWIVPKKKDASGKQKWRVVVDYRKLNEKTIDDRYPLPNISDLLDKLGRCQYFTTLDLASGFHQIEIDEESIEKTAFSTEFGHHEFLRMPFGLKNAPATFQRVMDQILRGLVNKTCLVYLDDIIIFSTSLQEHISNIKEIFNRLRDAGLKIQLDKSEFIKREVAYLGHIVTPEGVKPNPGKIKAIKGYPIPKTTKEIKSFLGLLGYYRKFIPDFAKLTKPLTLCLKKNAKIDVNNTEYKNCFEICKNILTDEPILQFPDFSKPFNLTTDASNVALGAVLSQGPIGNDKPVAYASRTLNNHEQNYSTIEKELLAIVWATKYFRPYLYGRKFKIITDHRPLQWIFSLKEPSSKLVRWRLKLEEFDYEIIYKKGSLNTNADALSRVELNTNEMSEIQKTIQRIKKEIAEQNNTAPENNTEQPDNTDSLSMIAQPDTEDIEDLDQFVNQKYQELIEDSDLNPFLVFDPEPSLRSYFSTCNPELDDTNTVIIEQPAVNEQEEGEVEDINTIHSSDENPIIGIPISESALNVNRNQIIIKSVKISPKPTKNILLHKDKQRLIVEIPEENPEEPLIKFIKDYISPKVKYCLHFQPIESNLYQILSTILQRNFKSSGINFVKCNKILKDVTNETQKEDIIQRYHEGITNHRGGKEIYEELKEIYYWPNMMQQIQQFINNCEPCQLTKYDRKPLKLLMNKTPTASRPFEIIHMDTITLDGNKFFTLVDSFSKYAQAYSIPSTQAIVISDKLVDYFSHHGLPTLIITDNGAEFKNTIIKELLAFHRIEVHFNSSQHPESNGIVERFHSTLIEHIRIFNNRKEFENEPLHTKVRYAILAYNNTIHSVTKLRPIQVITGHLETKDPIEADIDRQLTTNYISNHKEKTKLLYKILNETIEEKKEKVVMKINKNKETLPEVPTEILVKNKQKQSKLKNKYKPEKVESINKELKTANITKTHHNTSERIHLSNIKRPNVSGSSKASLPGPSQTVPKQ